LEEICLNRWADVQIDGSLQTIDQGIILMIRLAERIARASDASVVEAALDDLESAAYSTARAMRCPIALYPTRQAALPFDAGHVLSAAVDQFLPRSIQAVWQTIDAGAALAKRCAIATLPRDKLSELEIAYLDWATPRLIGHILPEANAYE
jgi:hypothetical protein